MGVNLKVMFSFMVAHADFERIVSHRCDFLLWRDPHERTVSTFFDKCRKAATANAAKVQNSQLVLMEAFGLSTLIDLQHVSFEEFVLMLPSVYMKDAHFSPQLDRLKPNQVGSVIDVATDLDGLGYRLGVDFTPRFNETEHDEAATYFTERTRAVIEQLYAEDFKALRHRPRSPIGRWLWRSW